MININLQIKKQHLIILLSIIGIFGIVILGNAYNEGDPTVVGHSWNDIGDKPAGFADGVDDTLSSISATGDIDMDNNRITNLDDPSNPQDAATMNYVDSSVGGGISECITRSADNGGSGWAVVHCPSGYYRTGCSTEVHEGANTRIYERPAGSNGCRGAEPKDWNDKVVVYAYCCK